MTNISRVLYQYCPRAWMDKRV